MAEVAIDLTLDELEETFGVLFIGYIVAMVAYGFTFFQTYIYFSRYPTDHRVIKATVAMLCLIDTCNSALISHALYHYLVLLFPLTTGLVHATSTYCGEFGLSIIAIFIVQLFYSFRLWSASHSIAVTATTAVISTAGFALGLMTTAKIAIDPAFASLSLADAKVVMILSQGCIFVSGLLTFGALGFYLRSSYNASIKPLEGWYDILVAYTISRGALAAIVQGCFLVSFSVAPNEATWMPFHLLSSKMFINSLLTMLNSRDVHRGQGINEEDIRTKSHIVSYLHVRKPTTNPSVLDFDDHRDTKAAAAVKNAQDSCETKDQRESGSQSTVIKAERENRSI